MGICDVWEAVEKLRQAFKTEPLAFDSVSSAVTAIDNVWLRWVVTAVAEEICECM